MQGTKEIRTERLYLRRYKPEDAEILYQKIGTDPVMVRYSGWNPYASLEMAREYWGQRFATEALRAVLKYRFLSERTDVLPLCRNYRYA